jgi:isopenicillin N synthase-like dioxygenase
MLATPHRVLGQGVKRRSLVFFLEPGLFGSIRPFSMEDVEAETPLEDTYAASILHTLRRSGRA